MSRKPPRREPQGPSLSPEQARIQLEQSLDRGKKLLEEQRISEERYEVWSDTAFAVLKAAFGEDSSYLHTFVGQQRITIAPVPETYAEPQRRQELQRRVSVLEAVIDHLPASSQQVSSTNVQPEPNRKVFLVHGHQHGVRETVARFLEKLELEPVILDEEPNRGRTIIEKFLENADVAFAIVLVIGDDIGGVKGSSSDELKLRARQNVILELGYFIGRLGRDRVCALYEPYVEMPSDITGMGYVEFDREGNWRLGVAKEIHAAGIKVDMNKLFT